MVFRGPFSKAKGKLNLVAFIVLAMADKNIIPSFEYVKSLLSDDVKDVVYWFKRSCFLERRIRI